MNFSSTRSRTQRSNLVETLMRQTAALDEGKQRVQQLSSENEEAVSANARSVFSYKSEEEHNGKVRPNENDKKMHSLIDAVRDPDTEFLSWGHQRRRLDTFTAHDQMGMGTEQLVPDLTVGQTQATNTNTTVCSSIYQQSLQKEPFPTVDPHSQTYTGNSLFSSEQPTKQPCVQLSSSSCLQIDLSDITLSGKQAPDMRGEASALSKREAHGMSSSLVITSSQPAAMTTRHELPPPRPFSRQVHATAATLGLINKTNREALEVVLPFRLTMASLPPPLEKRLPLDTPVFVSEIVRKVYDCKRMASPHAAHRAATLVTERQFRSRGLKAVSVPRRESQKGVNKRSSTILNNERQGDVSVLLNSTKGPCDDSIFIVHHQSASAVNEESHDGDEDGDTKPARNSLPSSDSSQSFYGGNNKKDNPSGSSPSQSDLGALTLLHYPHQKRLDTVSKAVGFSIKGEIHIPLHSTTAPIIESILQPTNRPISRMLVVKANTEKEWSSNPSNKFTTKTTLLNGSVITTAAKTQEKRLSGGVYDSPSSHKLINDNKNEPLPSRNLLPRLSNSSKVLAADPTVEVSVQRDKTLGPFEPVNFLSRFDSACDNIDTDIQQMINERSAASGKLEAAVYVVTRLSRPSYGNENKRRKDLSNKSFVASFRSFLRSLFRWAVGRIIIGIRNEGLHKIKLAKDHLEHLRAEKKINDEKAHYKARVRGATDLLEEVTEIMKLTKNQQKARESLIIGGVEYYLKLRKRFEYLCGDSKMVLSLSKLQEMASSVGAEFDVKLFRRIDVDRGGYLEFDEIAHALFPTILIKTIRNLMRRYDEQSGLKSTWCNKSSPFFSVGPRPSDASQQTSALQLTPESKEQVYLLFKATDRGSKGYVTRDDMITQFIMPTEDPNVNDEDKIPVPPGPFWFDDKFPRGDSVVNLPVFTEMVKFAFPPFKNLQSSSVNTYAYKPPPACILPAEIVELQLRLVDRPGYVQL